MRKLRLVTVLSVALALLGSVPANAGGPITSGSTVAGSVAGPTFLETWTFSGTSGNRVVITAVATSGAMTTTIVLKAPGGSTETSTTADRLEWQLLATGTYTIQIEDTGLNDAGTYALCFMNITAGPLTSPSDLNGGPIVSADVKTGTVGAADIDGFSFTGTNGNRVLIDGVATAGSLNTVIYLYPPGGGTFATWTGGGDRLDFQLTATGTWTILIEDSGNDTPGDYSMSLLNVTAGPLTNGSDTDGGAIASNEIKTGQFHQGVDFDAFTFTGTTGNRVVMVAVSTGAGSHNTQISLYPPGGGAAVTSSTADRLEAQLPANGTYTVVIEDSGNDNAGTYTTSLCNVTSGPFTSAGDLNGGPIVSADVKTGTMSGIADIDGYTFTGTNGNRVLMDAVATAGSLNTVIYLYPPGGGTFATWTGGGDRLDFQLNATGTWTILIEDSGNDTPGDYSMSLLNVTAGPLTNGSDTDGGAIASNEIKTGQFHQGVDFDAFTFTGTTGNRVVMVAVATGAGSHNTQISLYPPGGGAAVTSSTADRLEAQLPANGTYTVVIEDSGNDNPGTYTTSLCNVTSGPFTSAGDLNGGPIVSADVKTGTMSGIGDIDGYTFTGTNGNRVLIDGVATAGSLNTVIYLYPPGGGTFATWTGGGDRLDFQLDATGTWTILIEDIGNDTPGDYSMSLLNVTAGPLTNGSDTDGGAIASNEIKTGQFQQGVDFDAFTFTGTTGNRVVMVAVATGAGSHNTQISLYPPGGGAAVTSSTADRLEAQLPANGTYTVVIEDSGNDNPGTYTTSLCNVTSGPFTSAGDLNGGPIVSADVKTGTMSGIGDIDGYTFTGTNGNRVLIDAVATAGSLNTVIFLYPPGGGTFATWSGGGDRLDFQLTATGTWTILIEDSANDTPGDYSMSLLNVTAGPLSNGSDTDGGAIASNDIKTGQFQQGVDFDAFTFTGTTGNRVVMVAVATGAGSHNTQISLYPPGGGAAVTSSTSDRLEAQLPANGTYTIVIEDSGNDHPGTYTTSLCNVTAGPFTSAGDLNGGPIVSADVKTGTMSGIGDIDGYTFTGTNGNRVLIDAVATAGAGYNTVIFLYPPGGGTFATWSGGGDRLDFQLTATGTWTILIEDSANDTAGDYSMSLLNVTAGPLTNGSDTDGGAIASNDIKTGQFQQGVDFDAFTFTGSTNNRVVMVAVSTGAGSHNTQISLYPPGGGAAVTSSTADRLEAQLPANGTYTIVIEDSGNDHPGTYTASLCNVTAGPFTSAGDLNGGPIVSNEIKTGTTSGIADIDGYTFTGTNGNRVLIGGVLTSGANYNTVIYLYPPGGGTFATWSGGGDRLDFQLNATGTWTILIEDSGNDTAGGYNASLLNVTTGPYTGAPETDGGAIVSGVPRNGSALSSADFDGYTFNANAGDSVAISAVVTGGAMNTQISLFPPGGGSALTSTTADNVNMELIAGGTYTIVIEDSGIDQTGNYTVALNQFGGGGTDAPIFDDSTTGPLTTLLSPAYPSPFQSSTRLDFSIATPMDVQLRVFDVTGARVRSLVDRTLAPGRYPTHWDGRDDNGAPVASGIYYVQLMAGRETQLQKVVRIR